MIAPSGGDDFGPVFRFSEAGIEFRFAFRDGAAEAGSSEPAHLTRQMRPITAADGVAAVLEVWCTGASAFVYPVLPRAPQPVSAPELLRTLPYKPGMYGVNALSLMPLAEVPSPQGATSLGYDPSLYFTVERDFGTPGDLRELIDTAHEHGLAVLLDQVFNHTSNDFNPLWKIVLEHPGEEANPAEGDFTKEKLGRAHHMKLGSKSLRATAARQ